MDVINLFMNELKGLEVIVENDTLQINNNESFQNEIIT